MATELAMAMRKLKAQEALVLQVTDLNRKMDLVMKHLGMADEAPAADAMVEPKADEYTAVEGSEVKADEVPAVEPKAKKK